MRELRGFRSEAPNGINKVRVGALASRQAGRVNVAQLQLLGLGRATVHEWTRSGYLVRVLPRVYAVGHAAPSREGDLFAAVLYAGPGAALSHLTAAWWCGLVDFPGPLIHVSTPRQCSSQPGIRVHDRRHEQSRELVKGIPVTTRAQTLLDLAATTTDLTLVRKALARIEYTEGMLDVGPLREICGRGRPGSAALNRALDEYEPRFARTNGPLEDRFLLFCERRRHRGIPLPETNVMIADVKVDAYFRAHRLVVELDGDRNHRTPAQRRRDMRNEAILRSNGVLTVRYDSGLLDHEPRFVESDLLRVLAQRPG